MGAMARKNGAFTKWFGRILMGAGWTNMLKARFVYLPSTSLAKGKPGKLQDSLLLHSGSAQKNAQ